MQVPKLGRKPESKPIGPPIQGSKSKFNDAEYERWSEKLRRFGSSKGK